MATMEVTAVILEDHFNLFQDGTHPQPPLPPNACHHGRTSGDGCEFCAVLPVLQCGFACPTGVLGKKALSKLVSGALTFLTGQSMTVSLLEQKMLWH